QEGRASRGVASSVAEHAGVASRHAHRADGGEERGRAFRIVACAQDVAHQVEKQEADTLHHLGGEEIEADVGGELREPGGDAHGSSSSVAASLAQWMADEQGGPPRLSVASQWSGTETLSRILGS